MNAAIFFDDEDEIDDRAPSELVSKSSTPTAPVIPLYFASTPRFSAVDHNAINAHAWGRCAVVDVPVINPIPRIPQSPSNGTPINRSMDGVRANWIEIALERRQAMPSKERHRPTRRRIRGIVLSNSLDKRPWSPLDEKAADEGESRHYIGRLNRRWYQLDERDLAEILAILTNEPEQDDEFLPPLEPAEKAA